jgi:hypothetical protein
MSGKPGQAHVTRTESVRVALEFDGLCAWLSKTTGASSATAHAPLHQQPFADAGETRVNGAA